MKHRSFAQTTILAVLLSVSAIEGVWAHALLESSNPPVGGSVNAPSSVQLEFSQGVEARYSHVSVTGPDGTVPVSKPTNGGAKSALSIKLGQRLKPGSYHVRWTVVSVDTHKTQGSFNFEVRH